jgi:hypothetical protein
MNDEKCTCGHILDRHRLDWYGADADDMTPVWPCNSYGCNCVDFEHVKEKGADR